MTKLISKTDFPAISSEEWSAQVEKGLRGAEFETLTRETEDDIARGPLFCAEDLPQPLAPLGRKSIPLLDQRQWHIAAPVRDPDIGHANAQLLEDLKGGASAVRFDKGLGLSTQSDLKRVLEGVYTDLVPLQFAKEALESDGFQNLLGLERLKTAHVWAGLNPWKDAKAIKSALKTAPKNWRLMGVSPTDVHIAGGTDAQELAALAASLANAMRLYGAEVVCQNMVIDLSADRDTHLTIAKFRAARRIILRLADAFGADGSGIPLCAVTSLRMMQTEDAWTNLLRVMSAGFGAIIGGADMVTTRPFTDGLGQATPFAHRIARNMQLMMMEESHLGQVNDPAFGSYWHERLTEDLAQSAWEKFQTIETLGGFEAYVSSGQYRGAIDSSVEARKKKADPILGVSLHPAESVKAPEVRS